MLLETYKFAWNSFKAFKSDINFVVDELLLLPCNEDVPTLNTCLTNSKVWFEILPTGGFEQHLQRLSVPSTGKRSINGKMGKASDLTCFETFSTVLQCHNVTCNNFFINLGLIKALLSKNTSIVETVRSNREIPQICKSHADLIELMKLTTLRKSQIR